MAPKKKDDKGKTDEKENNKELVVPDYAKAEFSTLEVLKMLDKEDLLKDEAEALRTKAKNMKKRFETAMESITKLLDAEGAGLEKAKSDAQQIIEKNVKKEEAKPKAKAKGKPKGKAEPEKHEEKQEDVPRPDMAVREVNQCYIIAQKKSMEAALIRNKIHELHEGVNKAAEEIERSLKDGVNGREGPFDTVLSPQTLMDGTFLLTKSDLRPSAQQSTLLPTQLAGAADPDMQANDPHAISQEEKLDAEDFEAFAKVIGKKLGHGKERKRREIHNFLKGAESLANNATIHSKIAPFTIEDGSRVSVDISVTRKVDKFDVSYTTRSVEGPGRKMSSASSDEETPRNTASRLSDGIEGGSRRPSRRPGSLFVEAVISAASETEKGLSNALKRVVSSLSPKKSQSAHSVITLAMQNEGATQIQRKFREYLRKKEAATIVQKNWRRYMYKKRYDATTRGRQMAAILLQKSARGFQARKLVSQSRAYEESVAPSVAFSFTVQNVDYASLAKDRTRLLDFKAKMREVIAEEGMGLKTSVAQIRGPHDRKAAPEELEQRINVSLNPISPNVLQVDNTITPTNLAAAEKIANALNESITKPDAIAEKLSDVYRIGAAANGPIGIGSFSEATLQDVFMMKLTIKRATDLQSLGWKGTEVWCTCDSSRARRRAQAPKMTTRRSNTADPEWNETCEIISTVGENLVFTIYEKVAKGSSREALCTVPFEKFYPDGFEGSLAVSGSPDASLEICIMPPQEALRCLCGKILTESMQQCPECGRPRPDVVHCGMCGNAFLQGACFCAKCGQKRPDLDETSTQQRLSTISEMSRDTERRFSREPTFDGKEYEEDGSQPYIIAVTSTGGSREELAKAKQPFQEIVQMKLKIDGIDYVQLVSIPALAMSVKSVIKTAIVEEAGNHIKQSNVNVELSKGSVLATIKICDPTADLLRSSSHLLNSIRTKLAALPGIDAVKIGHIIVSKADAEAVCEAAGHVSQLNLGRKDQDFASRLPSSPQPSSQILSPASSTSQSVTGEEVLRVHLQQSRLAEQWPGQRKMDAYAEQPPLQSNLWSRRDEKTDLARRSSLAEPPMAPEESARMLTEPPPAPQESAAMLWKSSSSQKKLPDPPSDTDSKGRTSQFPFTEDQMTIMDTVKGLPGDRNSSDLYSPVTRRSDDLNVRTRQSPANTHKNAAQLEEIETRKLEKEVVRAAQRTGIPPDRTHTLRDPSPPFSLSDSKASPSRRYQIDSCLDEATAAQEWDAAVKVQSLYRGYQSRSNQRYTLRLSFAGLKFNRVDLMAFAEDLLYQFRVLGVRKHTISLLNVRLCDVCVAEVSGHVNSMKELWAKILDRPVQVMGYAAIAKIAQPKAAKPAPVSTVMSPKEKLGLIESRHTIAHSSPVSTAEGGWSPPAFTSGNLSTSHSPSFSPVEDGRLAGTPHVFRGNETTLPKDSDLQSKRPKDHSRYTYASPQASSPAKTTPSPKTAVTASLTPSPKMKESRVCESSSTDEVNLADYQKYSKTVAKLLAKGHDLVKYQVLRFMETEGQALQKGLVAEANFNPRPFEFRTERSDVKELERITIVINLQKRLDVFNVSYRSRTCLVSGEEKKDQLGEPIRTELFRAKQERDAVRAELAAAKAQCEKLHTQLCKDPAEKSKVVRDSGQLDASVWPSTLQEGSSLSSMAPARQQLASSGSQHGKATTGSIATAFATTPVGNGNLWSPRSIGSEATLRSPVAIGSAAPLLGEPLAPLNSAKGQSAAAAHVGHASAGVTGGRFRWHTGTSSALDDREYDSTAPTEFSRLVKDACLDEECLGEDDFTQVLSSRSRLASPGYPVPPPSRSPTASATTALSRDSSRREKLLGSSGGLSGTGGLASPFGEAARSIAFR